MQIHAHGSSYFPIHSRYYVPCGGVFAHHGYWVLVSPRDAYLNAVPFNNFQIGPAVGHQLEALLIDGGDRRVHASTCRSMHYHARPNADINNLITRQTWYARDTTPDYWVSCQTDRQIVYSSFGVRFQTRHRRLQNDV